MLAQPTAPEQPMEVTPLIEVTEQPEKIGEKRKRKSSDVAGRKKKSVDPDSVYIRMKGPLWKEKALQILEGLKDCADVNDPTNIFMLDGESVELKKTKDEIREDRRQYRKEYRSRPNVVQKRIEKSKDPLVIENRRKYSQREDVKLRKKELSKRRRRITKHVKETDPEFYRRLVIEARDLTDSSNSSSTDDSSSSEDGEVQ